VLLLLIANVLNIAADVAAMGEVGELVTGFNRHLMTLFIVVGTLVLQVFVPYHRYVFLLKWLTLSLLAYAGVLFTVHVPWGEVALRTIWPRFTLDADTATVVVGIFGTTISPYLFFWQASEEVEDMNSHRGAKALVRDKPAAGPELRRIKWDTWSGMLYSDITAYFIILATAVTLNVAGIKDINTAAEPSCSSPSAFSASVSSACQCSRAPEPTPFARRWTGNGASSGKRPTPADSTVSSRSACSRAWSSNIRRSVR
jgi:Mn2+/Fe2+ NRAMP family transporter